MPLAPGAVVGPYEIVSLIGAGGMGEVYRARDPRLKRDVALKTLPAPFAADAERLTRFEREARLLASVNHPSIAAIYGLEEADGSRFIVLELVEGGTLADRLRGGPLPVADALRIAREIADAVHAAHEKGIVHRDLKPANVALAGGTTPKVLDFGVAKAFVAEEEATTLHGGTAAGLVVGTLAYMSPEQARGAAVDRRSDIWSFGCVLYEMLTGRAAFAGRSATDVMVAILEREPDFSQLPAGTPTRVRWLLRRCLEKDPARRLHDLADARIELDEALADPRGDTGTGVAAAASRDRRRGREVIAWGLAALASIGLAAVLLLNRTSPEPSDGTPDVYRSAVILPAGIQFTDVDPAARFALSPDGRRLALVATDASGIPMLWIRPLDSLAAQPLAGTEGASYPFWSSDGRSVAFIARMPSQGVVGSGGRLRRVDVSGGQPVTLSDATFNAPGAWNRDGVILFTPGGNSPLCRLQASSGGKPVPVTTLDPESGDVQHSLPSFLPDGRHFLFTAIGSRTGANEARGVYLGSLDGKQAPRLLIEAGSQGRYASGHVLFLRDATLFAQRFDPDALRLDGSAFPLAEGVQITTRVSGGTGAFSVSDTGVLVYQTGLGVRSQLAWRDRAGRPLGDLGGQADYADVALSPDGARVMVSALDPQLGTRDLHVFDVSRGVHERFTSERSDDYAPVWSPGGDRVAFTSAREGSIEIYERSLNGTTPERRLDSGGSRLGKFAASWSQDGHLLFIAGGRAMARSDIHAMRMTGEARPRPILESPSVETQAKVSPDGRWLAFATNDSGRMEVYVSPFPGPAPRQRVSLQGGGWPRWRRDGRELFFLVQRGRATEYAVMAVSVAPAPGPSGLRLGAPSPLFDMRLRPLGRLDAYSYDVSADGQRFLFNTFVEEATSSGLTLVVNWPSAVGR